MTSQQQPSEPPFDLGLTRHWIAKCLVMGRKLEYIRGSLLKKGLPPAVVDAEITLAQESPYIKGGRTVYERDIQRIKAETKEQQASSAARNETSLKKQKQCSNLEIGDYIPNFIAKGRNGNLDVQSKAHSQFILILTERKPASHKLKSIKAKIHNKIPIYIITRQEDPASNSSNIFYEPKLKLFFTHQDDDHSLIILVSKNLKIKSIMRTCDIEQSLDKILAQIPNNYSSDHDSPAPILIVPNVISKDFCDRLINFAQENRLQGHTVNMQNKSRFHIAPSKSLLNELDDKLSRSLLPEIEKTFYSQITHRETYKICHYDSEMQGKFSPHRDTIDPYRHRRYGFSLALNDNFSGGGINFPEYNDNIISPKIGSAVVFPGSLFHQVSIVQTGIRWVLISFFFTKNEARPGKDESNEFSFQLAKDKLTLRSILPNELH